MAIKKAKVKEAIEKAKVEEVIEKAKVDKTLNHYTESDSYEAKGYNTDSDSDRTWVIGDEGEVGYYLDPAVLRAEQARLAAK